MHPSPMVETVKGPSVRVLTNYTAYQLTTGKRQQTPVYETAETRRREARNLISASPRLRGSSGGSWDLPLGIRDLQRIPGRRRAREPLPTFSVEFLDRRATQAWQVVLHVEADPGLQIRQVTVAFREPRQPRGVQLQ